MHDSGAIGAAWEVPETPAKTVPATAIAMRVLVIAVLLGANLASIYERRQIDDSGSNGAKLMVVPPARRN